MNTQPEASIGRHYLLYALPSTFKYQLAAGGECGHWASGQFKRVRSGDTLWIVSYFDGHLWLGGRLHIGQVLTAEEARVEVGENLWEAPWHVTAIAGSEEEMRQVDITGLALNLRFHGQKDRLPEDFNAQYLQTMRHLSAESVAALAALWGPARRGARVLPPGSSGNQPPGRTQSERQLDPIEVPDFDPADDDDARDRVLQAIAVRRGQGRFRRDLLRAYDGRCAMTGCVEVAVLDAAHIMPHLGERTNVVTNGLLLRTDVHTLFDLHLIGVDPSTLKIVVSEKVQEPTYRELHGRELALPVRTEWRPNAEALRLHFVQEQR